jgi:glycosyltransferase involved in cell wall biosynthesis
LNEAASIQACVTEARDALIRNDIPGEVIVVDNGSDDGSAELAAAAGARVIHEPIRGYGRAYLAGFAAARGRYILMADADMTYPMEDIPRFVADLDAGADMVIGDRLANLRPESMPWLHRNIGNPLMTGTLNLLFRTGVRDAQCGMRAFRRDLLPRLDLRTPGFEFISEMTIRAAKENLEIRQFPIDYHPREGESKLSSFSDGWRNLRFLLVHSPTYLFIIPGIALLVLGALICATVLANVHVFGRTWQLHTMIAGSMLVIVGSQVIGLGVCARAYGRYFLNDSTAYFDRMRARLRLEHGLLAGAVIVGIGVAMSAWIGIRWADRGFGGLAEERLAVLAATFVIVGVQVFFTSFLVSIIGLRRPD